MNAGAASGSRLVAAIVNHDTAGDVLRLLAALHADGFDAAVVVDNASEAADYEELAAGAAGYLWATVVKSEGNVGFGAGINRAADGLGLSDSDILFVLNPDVIPAPGALRELGRVIREGGADMVAPLILQGPAAHPVIAFVGGRVDLRFGTTKHELWGQPPGRAGVGLRPTEFITGAAFAVAGHVWRELRGFREDFFIYWEDADLSLRARQRGFKLVVDLDVSVRHDEGGSAPGRGRGTIYYRNMVRNRRQLLSEWAPNAPWPTVVLREVETVRLVLRALREPEGPALKALAVIAARLTG